MLLLRSQARDLVDVGAVDADVVQLAIGISRKLLQNVPIDAACAQTGAAWREAELVDLAPFWPPQFKSNSPRGGRTGCVSMEPW